MEFFDDEDDDHHAGETPVSVTIEWFTGWDKGRATDTDEYCYVLTWANGDTERRHTIPNRWHLVCSATHLANVEKALST